MKVWKIALNLYSKHLLGVLIGFFLIFPLAGFLDRPYLCGTVTALVLLSMIYSCGWKAGFRDARKIPGFYPDKVLPLKAAGIFLIVPFMLYMLRICFPEILPTAVPVMNGEIHFFISDNFIYGTPDFIYKLWYFPLNAFMGNGNLFMYAVILILEPLVSVLGYHVGVTRFRISGFIMQKLIYTNKKTKV